MSETSKIEPGQTWQRKDPRDGGKQVLVISADEHFVNVLGARRSRIRTARFPADYFLVAAPDGAA